jgi:hypothetical protein
LLITNFAPFHPSPQLSNNSICNGHPAGGGGGIFGCGGGNDDFNGGDLSISCLVEGVVMGIGSTLCRNGFNGRLGFAFNLLILSLSEAFNSGGGFGFISNLGIGIDFIVGSFVPRYLTFFILVSAVGLVVGEAIYSVESTA